MTTATHTPATPVRTPNVASRAAGTAAAEVFFTADRAIADWKKSAAGKKVATWEGEKKQAIETLAGLYPVASDHADAIHAITVYGNDTATFLHRADSSVKWQKVAEGIAPHLPPSLRQIFDNLVAEHTGDRVTRTLKR